MSTVRISMSGIQEWLFHSNTLLDTIGRSVLLAQATDPKSGWLAELLEAFHLDIRDRSPQGLELEGDAAALKRFTTAYLTRIHADMTGLETSVVSDPHDVADQGASIRALKARLGSPLSLDVAVPATTVRAEGDAHPATGELRGRPASRGHLQAAHAGRAWHRGIGSMSLGCAPAGAPRSGVYPLDLDAMGGSKGRKDLMGVVVADINGLGTALSRVPQDKHPLISATLSELGTALGEWVRQGVGELIDKDSDTVAVQGSPTELTFDLHPDRTPQNGPRAGENRYFLPARPLIAAGDDFAFACDGRIALSLAERILQFFDADDPIACKPLKQLAVTCPSVFSLPGRRDPHECPDSRSEALWLGVGIAVVPTGYPLISAHRLAENECERAKRLWHADQAAGSSPRYHCVSWRVGRAAPETMGPTNRPYVRGHLAGFVSGKDHQWADLLNGIDSRVPGSLRCVDRDSADDGKGWGHRRTVLEQIRPYVFSARASELIAQDLTKLSKRFEAPPLPRVANRRTFRQGEMIDPAGLRDALELLPWHLDTVLTKLPREEVR